MFILLLLQMMVLLSLLATSVGIIIDLTLRAVSGNHFTGNEVNRVLVEFYSVTGSMFVVSLVLSMIVDMIVDIFVGN